MNIQQLEYVVALDKFRHFANAADHCNVTQPTLSTMISKLEEELGVKIFDRSRQPLMPTAIGATIIEQAQKILYEWKQIPVLVQNESASLEGTIRLGILPTIAPYLLPMMLPVWRKALPKLKIQLSELQTSQCLEQLLTDQIDMAIIASKAETAGIKDDLLYFEEFFAYVSKEEPLFSESLVRSADVDAKRLWLLDEGHCFRDQLLRFCEIKAEFDHQTSYSQGSMESFMRLVEAGEGLTFLPELAVNTLSEVQKSLIRPFAIPRPVREIRLAINEVNVRVNLFNELLRLIQSVVPAKMHKLQVGQFLA